MDTQTDRQTDQLRSRKVTVSKDQLMVSFTLLLIGQLEALVRHAPPHELADVLVQRAAGLLAAIDNPDVRADITTQLAGRFLSLVEEQAVAFRTTKGGIIVPRGVG